MNEMTPLLDRRMLLPYALTALVMSGLLLRADDVPVKPGKLSEIEEIKHRLDLIEMNTLKTVRIVAGTAKNKNVMLSHGKKLVWMSLTTAKGTKVILPSFIVEDNGEAKEPPFGNQLIEAWRQRVKGVYKIDYSTPEAREAFKDCIVDISK